MASWPETTRLIGTEIPRIDGLAKASGRAKYPSDENPKGTLYGAMLYSPHAHAKITSIDTSAAEKLPGVKAVVVIAGAGKTVRFHGDDIAAVAAETEEQARDAIHAIKVEFEVLPHVATEPAAMAEGAPEVARGGNVKPGRAQSTGNPDLALGEADVVVEGDYNVPVITHVCLEPHGLTIQWEGGDKIRAYSSTQAIQATAGELAGRFEIPQSNVEVITEVMGGGFGSKFGADIWGITAAELSKKAGRPVKMFLDRAQEHLGGGNRPSASATIKLGASKDGTIKVVTAETHGTGGISRGAQFPFPYIYAVPNSRRVHSDVFLNGGNARAMRAPGHPQASIMMEAILDDLAAKIGVDPVALRKRNLPEGDFKTPIYLAEIEIGQKLIGWAENFKPRGENAQAKGPVKRGLGIALQTWGGGGAQDKQVACTINPDGSVEVKSATQDLGTGTRTILAIIAAELLGLEVKDITSNIGHSNFPPGQASGGSTTAPSMSPPTFNAVSQARDQLFKKIAPALGADAADLSVANGQVLVKGEAKLSWKDACRKIGMMPISVTAGFEEGLSANGVGGVQFADVSVDVETGVVKLNKIVVVQDSGLILDMLTWRSQVYGGVIMGLNYGLFEERVMDPSTGLMLNPDMELYKLAGASDIPEIICEAYDTPEMRARGVIGIGEPPTIGTAAAIGNAVANAIGVRVPHWPMSPMNVLNALAAQKGEA